MKSGVVNCVLVCVMALTMPLELMAQDEPHDANTAEESLTQEDANHEDTGAAAATTEDSDPESAPGQPSAIQSDGPAVKQEGGNPVEGEQGSPAPSARNPRHPGRRPMTRHPEKSAASKSLLQSLLADLSLSISLGQAVLINPNPRGAADATSVLFSPGYQISPSLRAELGIVFALYNRKQGAFDLQVRSMLIVAPARWDLYGRLTTGAALLLTGPASFLLGGALGTTMKTSRRDPTTLFFEAGTLAHGDYTLTEKYRLHWLVEARVGGTYSF